SGAGTASGGRRSARRWRRFRQLRYGPLQSGLSALPGSGLASVHRTDRRRYLPPAHSAIRRSLSLHQRQSPAPRWLDGSDPLPSHRLADLALSLLGTACRLPLLNTSGSSATFGTRTPLQPSRSGGQRRRRARWLRIGPLDLALG